MKAIKLYHKHKFSYSYSDYNPRFTTKTKSIIKYEELIDTLLRALISYLYAKHIMHIHHHYKNHDRSQTVQNKRIRKSTYIVIP